MEWTGGSNAQNRSGIPWKEVLIVVESGGGGGGNLILGIITGEDDGHLLKHGCYLTMPYPTSEEVPWRNGMEFFEQHRCGSSWTNGFNVIPISGLNSESCILSHWGLIVVNFPHAARNPRKGGIIRREKSTKCLEYTTPRNYEFK
jgi:hypothetical protein